jgi:hypothetical protein
MADSRPDYLAEPPTIELAVLMRIKGSWRRLMVAREMKQHGLLSVPDLWRGESIPETLKSMLAAPDPRRRGGEDLPSLAPGEVEIARLQLLDTVHGEVTSLRARRDGARIALRLVDEQRTDFRLPHATIDRPFTSEELMQFLRACHPSPFRSDLRSGLSSWFHPDLPSPV